MRRGIPAWHPASPRPSLLSKKCKGASPPPPPLPAGGRPSHRGLQSHQPIPSHSTSALQLLGTSRLQGPGHSEGRAGLAHSPGGSRPGRRETRCQQAAELAGSVGLPPDASETSLLGHIPAWGTLGLPRFPLAASGRWGGTKIQHFWAGKSRAGIILGTASHDGWRQLRLLKARQCPGRWTRPEPPPLLPARPRNWAFFPHEVDVSLPGKRGGDTAASLRPRQPQLSRSPTSWAM